MDKRKYDSTIARMAGNIAGTMYIRYNGDMDKIAERSVRLARAIVAEVERTDPYRVVDHVGAVTP